MMYARHASAAFNARLQAVLQGITSDVQHVMGQNLVALILGGGYGRGEGGVVQVNGMEQPYNDLDFTLLVQRKQDTPWDALAAISKRYEADIKIHVDFSRPLTLHDIQHWPRWLMWWDLLHGHVVLAGAPDILRAHAPATLQEPLPLIEATRLLLNRGAGLLWALRVVRGIDSPPDADFVRRNYYKCALALGDALLIAQQRFTTQYHGRDERFEQLTKSVADISAMQLESLYRTALRFKFCPDAVCKAPCDETRLCTLAKQWGTVFFYIERQRTCHAWPSLMEYTQWRGLREPEQHAPEKWLRNVACNAQLGTWSWRYPRESLYGQLPVLLGLSGAPSVDWPTETSRFMAIWNRFN